MQKAKDRRLPETQTLPSLVYFQDEVPKIEQLGFGTFHDYTRALEVQIKIVLCKLPVDVSGPVLKHNSGLDGRPCYLRPGERRNRQTLACNYFEEYAKMYQVKLHVQKLAFFLTISDLQIGVRVRLRVRVFRSEHAL